ncbi:hypothetical protein NE237_001238 [Protea cynaroides]|uniref:Uncharacterized protein n=1 Tax=Protea cynaroides TaxID=273540 RepID=A0A9Q0KSQ8_9MAGN|nr:hypothetical protein NE237_001238 [Protea cynaroides]
MQTGFFNIVLVVYTCFLFVSSSGSLISISPFLGIHHPQGFLSLYLIKCKDGSKFFTRDRLNDGFCDCVDGTDEPGFKMSSTIILSSVIQWLLSDSNHVFKDGNTLQKNDDYNLKSIHLVGVDIREASGRMSLEDLIQKLKELKIVVVGEVVLTSCVMAFLLFHHVSGLEEEKISLKM